MAKTLLLSLTTVFVVINISYSQITEPPVPCLNGTENTCTCDDAPVLCTIDALDGFGYSMTTYLHPGDGPDPMCSGTEGNNTASHNPTWIGFLAWCSDLTVEVVYSNCQNNPNSCNSLGIQVAVYEDCSLDPSSAISCDTDVSGCTNNSSRTLNITGMIIGNTYYFLVDGCCGSACDIVINVIGSCGENTIPEFSEEDEQIQGPDVICFPTGLLTYYLEKGHPGAVNYQWTVAPVGGSTTLLAYGEDILSVDYEFPSIGEYEICVDVDNEPCISLADAPDLFCKTILVIDESADAGDLTAAPACPNSEITFSTSNYTDSPDFEQWVFVTDPSGTILYTQQGNSGSYTYDMCGTLNFYSYNYFVGDLESGYTMPEPGININNFSLCEACLCDLQSMDLTWEDNVAPVFDNPPGDITVDCFEEVGVIPDLTFTDNCLSAGSVTGIDAGSSDNCLGGSYTRTWTITDECNNTQTYVQNILVNPSPVPMFTDIPSDVTLSCADLLNGQVPANYTNNSIGSCLISGSVDGVPDASPDICGGSVLYTWTTQDACGNDIAETQLVSIDPPLDVVFIAEPDDITISCNDLPFTPVNLNYTNNDVGACLISGLEDTPDVSGTLVDCNDMILITWEVIDFCGRSFTADQQVTLEDIETPTFVNPPGPLTFDCILDVPSAEDAEWADNCDGSGFVPLLSEVVNMTTCTGGDLIRTWEYTDNCGITGTHTQTIMINPPVQVDWITTLPQNITVACGEAYDPIITLDYSNSTGDSCEESGTITGAEVGQLLICGDVITRTWDYTPLCGLPISHTQTITLEDVTPPELQNEPISDVFECYLEVPVMVDLVWMDNCDGTGSVSGVESGTVNACLGGTLTRTWTYTDQCNNTDTHTQILTVNPVPNLYWTTTPPMSISVQCGETLPPLADLGYSNAPTGTNCLEEGTVSPQETGSLVLCGDQIIRTWEVLNPACGPDLIHQQIISLEDTDDPELQNEPGDIIIECALLLPQMPDLAWNDNCDGNGIVMGIESGTIDNCNGGTLTRTWSYTDQCNNTDTHTQTITVNPVPDIMWTSTLPPAVVNVGCGDPLPPSQDLNYSNNANDALCLELGSVSPTDVGQLLVCGDEIIRTWTVVPPTCGPGLVYIQTITLEDMDAPELQNEPLDITFDCAVELTPMIDLDWTDNCDGMGTVPGIENGTIDDCSGGSITRTWTYTDQCGNPDTHIQNITVNAVPDIMWTTSLPPDQVFIACGDPIPPVFNLDYSNGSSNANCLVNGSVPPVEVGTLVVCGDEIIRTWTVAPPACGPGLDFIQTITLVDTEEPILQNEPIDITLNCVSDMPLMDDLMWTDNCDGMGTVSGVEDGLIDNCAGGSITRTWTYTDQCGNTDTHVQTINVDPVPDIVWTSSLPAATVTIQCGDPLPPLVDLDYSNNAINPNCAESGTIPPVESGMLVMCGDQIIRTWEFLTPICGPGLTYTQTITLDDTSPPTFINLPPASIQLTCIGDLPPSMDLDWMDNCDGTGSVAPGESGTLEACTGGSITRTWEYTDICGNGPVIFNQIITLAAPLPTACDDNDLCTINDVATVDCEGTICIPCQGVITDCTGETELVVCNDNDDCTIDDMVEIACDGSICTPCQGVLTDCTNGLTFQETCSDGDPCTINDMRTIDCQGQECIPCAGTPTTTPDPMLDGPMLTCFGQSATLSATGCSGDVIWFDDANGTNIVNVGSTFITPSLSSNTTYYALCDIAGCESNIISITLNIVNAQTTTIVGDDLICQGEISLLDAGSGFVNYDWGITNGQTLTVFNSGTYEVTVTDSNGCTSTDNFTVQVISPEDPIIGGSLTYCIGGNTTLSVDPSFTTFEWSPNGETSNSIVVNTTGNYSVTVTDSDGCTSSTLVEVTESNTLDPQITGDLILCVGQSSILSVGSFDSYNWSPNGESSTSIIITGPGTYGVTVSDASGCTGFSSIEVVESTIPPVEITGPEIICQGDVAALDAFNLDYGNYLWSTGSINSTITVSDADIYTVSVTDINGCQSSSSIEITYFTSTDLMISGDLVICQGLSTVLSGQTGYATYDWLPNGETTPTITVSEAGSYSLTTSDNNGCTFSSSVNVTSLADLELFIGGSLSYCEGSSTVLDAGTWNSYSWMPNSETTQSIAVSSPGTYSVVVSDQSGCTASSSVVIQEDTELSPTISGDLIVCFDEFANVFVVGNYTSVLWSDNTTNNNNTVLPGFHSVTVTDLTGCTGTSEIEVIEQNVASVTISGDLEICAGNTTQLDASTGFDTYLWSNGLNTTSIDINTGGSYSVTATDDQGCTNSSSAVVNVSSITPPEIQGNPTICSGSSTMLSSSGFEEYLWNTQENTSSITITTGGNYILTVTDALGCTSSSSMSITENSQPNAIILGSTSYCIGGFTELSVESTFTSILWSTTESTSIINVMQAGAVSVTVTDENGCTGTSAIMIQEDSELSPSITGDLIVCENSSVDLTTAGNYPIILWSNEGITNTVNVGVGDYSVTVTDNSGCTGSSQVSVTSQTAQQVDIIGNNEFCEGTSVNLEASSGYDNYIWSTGFNGQIFTATITGSYSVTATDALGCTSESSTTVTAVPIGVPVISGPQTFCEGETITLIVSGFEDYIWSTGENTASIEINENGNYTVTVTDILGCTSSTTASIIENDLPSVTIVGSTSFCIGGSSELALDEVYTLVDWSTGESTDQISVMQTGSVSVTVTDVNGCTGSSIVSITQEEFLSPNIGGNPNICEGDQTTLDAGAFDTWEWSTGEMTQTIDVTLAGSYEVTVTDNSGCTGSSAVEVIINSNPSPIIEGIDNFCFGATTTLSNLEVFDSYLWSTGDAGNTLEVNSPGTYGLIVTDNNGCTGTSEIMVQMNLAPNTTVLASCNEEMTMYDVTVTTDGDLVTADPYTVSNINGVFVIENVDLLSSIDIYVQNSDTTCDTLITVNPPNCECLAISDAGDNQLIDCDALIATLGGSNTTVGANFQFVWYDELGNVLGNESTLDVMDEGEYTLEVFDLLNNCSDISMTSVIDESNVPLAIISAAPDNVIDCVIDAVILSTDQQQNVEYTWIFNKLESNDLEITIDTEGEVTLMAIDTITGCSAENSLFINNQEEYPLVQIVEPDILTCDVLNVIIDASASQDGNNIVYQWYDEDGPVGLEDTNMLNVSEAGSYYFEAIDTSNNCMNVDTVEVLMLENFPTIESQNELVYPCDVTSLQISIDVLTTGSVLFEWSTPDGTILGTDQSQEIVVDGPGLYQVEVSDLLSGCSVLDTIMILQNEGPESFEDTVIQPECAEDNTGEIIVEVLSGGTAPFMYALNEEQNSTGVFVGLSGGSYTVEVADALGCIHDTIIILDSPEEVLLSVDKPLIQTTFGADEEVMLITNLIQEEIEEIVYEPELPFQNNNSLSLTFEDIMENMTYLVTIYDENGCQDTTAFSIVFNQRDDIFIPNIINVASNDNDVFYPQSGTIGIITDEMFIYDRWGNLIYYDESFPTNDPEFGWDGTFNGSNVEAGVYVYSFVFNYPGLGKIVKVGDVTVIF